MAVLEKVLLYPNHTKQYDPSDISKILVEIQTKLGLSNLCRIELPRNEFIMISSILQSQFTTEEKEKMMKIVVDSICRIYKDIEFRPVHGLKNKNPMVPGAHGVEDVNDIVATEIDKIKILVDTSNIQETETSGDTDKPMRKKRKLDPKQFDTFKHRCQNIASRIRLSKIFLNRIVIENLVDEKITEYTKEYNRLALTSFNPYISKRNDAHWDKLRKELSEENA